MFRSRTMDRRPRRAACRPLGFELMEERWMLSATTLVFPQAEFETAISIMAGTDQPVVVSARPADGFITIFNDPLATFDGNDHVRPASGGDRSDPPARRAFEDSLPLGGSNEVPWVLDVFSPASGGLRPIAFDLGGQAPSSVGPSTGPTVADRVGHEVARSEGGSISIEAILAHVGPGRQLDAGGRAASPDGDTLGGTARPRTGFASGDSMSGDREISGEWARAMVLEMGGGPPMAIDRPYMSGVGEDEPAADEDARPVLREPLSSHRARGADGAAASKVGDTMQSAERTATQARTPAGDRVANSESAADPGNVPPRAGDSDRLASPMGDGQHGTGVADSVLSAAFEQFGASDNALLYRWAEPSRRAVTAAPLLMILALERITARSSRRADPDAADGATWLPRRWRAAPNAREQP